MKEKLKQSVAIRVPQVIYQRILGDLLRPHKFAHERIGFLYTKSKVL